MTPRQPSVPKRMVFTGTVYAKGRRARSRGVLQQLLQAMLVEPFHHAAHFLRAFPGADQQCVLCFHYNQIGNAYRGDKFRGTPDEISRGIESEHTAGGNVSSGAPG